MVSHPSLELLQRQRTLLLVALSLLAASTLHFEVLLTKLFANKLEHHFTFAVISIALLGFGAAGVFVHLSNRRHEPDRDVDVVRLWRFCIAFALSMPLTVAGFVVMPLDPGFGGVGGALALPVYFLLFAIPFFLGGVCVCALLVARGFRPTRVYFWDLLGAGVGAALGTALLPWVGGYGSVAVASLVAGAAALIMRAQRPDATRRRSMAVAVVSLGATALLVMLVPRSMHDAFGFDMVSFKHIALKAEFFSFGRIAQTYWNPIARIDVSPTGTSTNGGFRYGLSRSLWNAPLYGRMILVDGSANTRQYVFDEPPKRDGILGSVLWAAPYVMRPESERALIVGPGGGIDILVGKAFGVREIDAVELNPDMFDLLIGRAEDPERDLYTRWLGTDERTTVQVYQAEARHFARAHRGAASYDVVLASGVDTLTAIQTAGNALSENFLYTKEAVQEYVRLLEPGGQLALTHWHLDPPTLALKMLVTYLEVLDEQGVKEPGRRLCVISEGFWENALLKNGSDYTQAEVARLRDFADNNGFQVVYDPFMADDAPVVRPNDVLFRRLARADTAERARVFAELPYDLTPATDARPYFYWIRSKANGWAVMDDGGWIFPQRSVRWMFVLALGLSVLLTVGPGVVLWRQREPLAPALRAVPFFAATGLGFILAENALFQLLTLFVGGPLFSLSVVLPAVLVGYSFGSLASLRLASATRAGAVRLVVFYALGFCLFAMVARWGLPAMIGASAETRLAVAALAVVPFGALLGLATPWYMEILKVRSHSMQRGLAWMWAISSAANVMGSLLFVPICQQLSIHGTFAAAGALYVAALLWAALGQGGTAVLRTTKAAV